MDHLASDGQIELIGSAQVTRNQVAVIQLSVAVFTLRIQEVEQGDWAIGGKTLTAADVHALAGRKAA